VYPIRLGKCRMAPDFVSLRLFFCTGGGKIAFRFERKSVAEALLTLEPFDNVVELSRMAMYRYAICWHWLSFFVSLQKDYGSSASFSLARFRFVWTRVLSFAALLCGRHLRNNLSLQPFHAEPTP
jgi:hypothetical protein